MERGRERETESVFFFSLRLRVGFSSTTKNKQGTKTEGRDECELEKERKGGARALRSLVRQGRGQGAKEAGGGAAKWGKKEKGTIEFVLFYLCRLFEGARFLSL